MDPVGSTRRVVPAACARGRRRFDYRLLAVETEQARTTGLLKGLGLAGRAYPAPHTPSRWE